MSYYFSYFGSQQEFVEVGDHVLIEVNLNTPFMGMTKEYLWTKVNYVNKDGSCTVTVVSESSVVAAHLNKGDRVDIGLEHIGNLSKLKKM